MPSQVYYRKWRPQRLDQVIGQEPVTRTLRQAIATDRVAHAYLFCGPRGTGKTSTARILAKAVNCQQPEQGEPCNACAICQAMNEGRALDLIEIDAASHRGIDDIRNLREKVHFAPNEAKFKVYVIDEVHMLTTEAFNALLKTLEEPPEHAIFVLATTEAHKVPLTIVSRCQRFDFRRIPQDDIAGRLGALCQEEGVEVEQEVLMTIGRSSSGSLRDAENLLEQLVVSYTPPITMEHVRNLFGLEDDEKGLELTRHILSGNVQGGLITINEVASQGRDIRQLHRSVLDFLRSVMLQKSGAGASLAYPRETMSSLQSLAQSASMDQILAAVKAFAQPNTRLDSSSPIALELALIESSLHETLPRSTSEETSQRQASAPAEGTRPQKPITEAQEQASPRPQEMASNASEAKDAESDVSTPKPEVEKPDETPFPAPLAPKEQAIRDRKVETSEGQTSLAEQWNALLKSLNRKKGKRFFIGGLLRSCKSYSIEGERLVLKYSHRSNMERMREEWEDPPTRKAIREAVEQAMGQPYELAVDLQNGENGGPIRPLSQSHLVRAAMKMGATIVEEKKENDK